MRKLIAYRIHATGQRIVAGRSRRHGWTKHITATRIAVYRSRLPMQWVGKSRFPPGLTAEWNGGNNLSDVTVESGDPAYAVDQLALFAFRPRHFDVPRKLFVSDGAGDRAVGAGSAQLAEGWHRAT